MIYCVDVGGSYMKFGVISPPGRIEALGKVRTPIGDFDSFARVLAENLGGNARAGASAPVVIALPGVVDPDTHMVTCANVPCLDGRQAGPDLEKALGRAVLIANDADCFAMAEAAAGAGRGHRIVFGIILGTGVGGGLVVDGRIVVGSGGLTGEWGHGPAIAEPRFACGCGQTGCVNTIGGARGLERLHEYFHGQALHSEQIVLAWQAGERAACKTIEAYVDLVSNPLAMVVNVVGASVVPAGGGLATVPELIALIDGAVRTRILRKTSAPLVVPAQVPGGSGLAGAGFLGLRTFAKEGPI